MRQIPPSCLMFQGYDRTVYKMSSVIYTVIISRGALNFRFTCSFSAGPRFRLIPGCSRAEGPRGSGGPVATSLTPRDSGAGQNILRAPRNQRRGLPVGWLRAGPGAGEHRGPGPRPGGRRVGSFFSLSHSSSHGHGSC